jgi:hypothetical protein
MTVAEDEGQLEKAAAEQIIANTPLIDGIESVTVELGQDHDGDPALWLVFHMRQNLDLGPKDPWFDPFNEFSNQIGMRIIDSGFTRFPYIRLRAPA